MIITIQSLAYKQLNGNQEQKHYEKNKKDTKLACWRNKSELYAGTNISFISFCK